mgnify:CR=1 FL=1
MPSEWATVVYWLSLAGVFVQLYGGDLADGIGDAYAFNDDEASEMEFQASEADPVETWISRFAVASEVLMTGINAPYAQFYKSMSEITAVDAAIVCS